jgi:hypothetical protein
MVLVVTTAEDCPGTALDLRSYTRSTGRELLMAENKLGEVESCVELWTVMNNEQLRGVSGLDETTFVGSPYSCM